MGERSPTFGELLRQYRVRSGLSQELLAEQAGLSTRGISDLERGLRRTPQRETLRLLVAALSLTAQEQTHLEHAIVRRRQPRAAEPPAPPRAIPRMECSYPFPTPATLVGRDDELRQIDAVLHQPRPRGQVLMIGGPGGAGKSTLLGMLVRRAEQTGALCLAGAAYEQEGVVPFGPFHDALASYLLRHSADSLTVSLGFIARDLAHVVPELRYYLGLTEPPAGESFEPVRVFAAVHAFLRELTAAGPVLLCLEDLHAADAATLQLLGYLARQVGHTTRDLPLTLAGTYRTDEVPPTHPLARLMAGLARERRVVRVDLSPLDRDATAHLASALLEGPTSESLNDWVFATSQGNPLFVEQLVLALREDGRVAQRGGLWREVASRPESVSTPVLGLIGGRFERLSARCRDTLAVAAVLGRAIRPDLLVAMLEPRDEASVLEDLDEALDAQLLQEGPDCYVFGHALVREAIYAGLRAPRRHLLHARAGEMLERLGGTRPDDLAAELAYHFQHAGSTARLRPKLLRYSLEAGRRAAGLSSFREALGHFEAACQAADGEGDAVDPEQRLLALEGRARAERELARWPESVSSFRRVRDLAATSVQRAAAHNMAASALLHTGDIAQVLAECDAGLAELAGAEGPDAIAARIYLQQQIALVRYLQGRYRDVLELGQTMLLDAEALDRPHPLMLANSVVAWGCMGLGRVALGLEHDIRAVAAAEQVGDKVHIAIALENLGFQSYLGGRFTAAREHLMRSLLLYRASAGELRAVNAQQHLCRVLIAEGELARARQQAALAVELEIDGQDRWAADGHQLLGTIDTLRADWEAARAQLEQALAIRRRVGDAAGTVESTVALGDVDHHVGALNHAAECYGEAVRLAERVDPGPAVVRAWRHLGRHRLRQGDSDGAAAAIDQALAWAEEIPESLEYAPTLSARAELIEHAGAYDEAVALAERAIERPMPLDQRVESLALAAGLQAGRRSRERAIALAGEAVAAATTLGAPRLLSLAYLAAGQAAAASRDRAGAAAHLDAALREAERARAPQERALADRARAEL